MINEMQRGGPQRLQFVTDFDYTLTKQKMDNNEKVLTSFGMFDHCQSLPQSYRSESLKLFNTYRPIECDPHLPVTEKVQYMIEWWQKSSELLKGFPLPHGEIEAIAAHYKDALRNGTHELFQELDELKIPCLVFSAGLGDCVMGVLNHAKINYPNVKVVSNFLQYKDGVLDGFQGKIIHTFNKNETALEGTEYYDLVHSRDHVIVMGDSLGDAGMAEGMPSTAHVLKIGFLFDHVEHNLPKYLDTFDIVLVDDQSVEVPQAILDLVKVGGQTANEDNA
jgi:cytosolic 5'-nucleotidase 3